MALVRATRDPFALLGSTFLPEFYRYPSRSDRGLFSSTDGLFSQDVRVFKDEDSAVVQCDLPGVKLEDLDVSATPDASGMLLSVTAQREVAGACQKFSWSSHFNGVDSDALEASLTDGVLTVTVPAAQAPSVRKIEVAPGSKSHDLALEPEGVSEEEGVQKEQVVE